jgi:hypothetical protein
MNTRCIPAWVYASIDAEVGGELRAFEIRAMEHARETYLLIDSERPPTGPSRWGVVALAVDATGRIADWQAWTIRTSRIRSCMALTLLGLAQVDPALMGPFGFVADLRDSKRASD